MSNVRDEIELGQEQGRRPYAIELKTGTGELIWRRRCATPGEAEAILLDIPPDCATTTTVSHDSKPTGSLYEIAREALRGGRSLAQQIEE